jgi:hypothetical protein
MGSREGMYRFRDETVSESGSKGVGVKSREMDGCSTGWLWISSRRPERKATKVGRDFWLAACIYLIFEAPRLLAATWPKGHILLSLHPEPPQVLRFPPGSVYQSTEKWFSSLVQSS